MASRKSPRIAVSRTAAPLTTGSGCSKCGRTPAPAYSMSGAPPCQPIRLTPTAVSCLPLTILFLTVLQSTSCGDACKRCLGPTVSSCVLAPRGSGIFWAAPHTSLQWQVWTPELLHYVGVVCRPHCRTCFLSAGTADGYAEGARPGDPPSGHVEHPREGLLARACYLLLPTCGPRRCWCMPQCAEPWRAPASGVGVPGFCGHDHASTGLCPICVMPWQTQSASSPRDLFFCAPALFAYPACAWTVLWERPLTPKAGCSLQKWPRWCQTGVFPHAGDREFLPRRHRSRQV